jgi:hypothetical protein
MLDRCPRYGVFNDPLSFLAPDNSKKRPAPSLLWRMAPAGLAAAGARQLIFDENLPTFGANCLYRVKADPNSGYRY